MSLDLHFYYRGSLSSCNYACDYCPFAKTKNSRAELEADADDLRRFVGWVAGRKQDRLSVMFTPWGEALIRQPYREAMVELSQLAQVHRVVAQTNLSYEVDWTAGADKESLALWCTYHPSQVERDTFLARCRRLSALGVRYSVGMVGMVADLEEIEAMREELDEEVYLWVNAYKRDGAKYYSDPQVARLVAVDPLF